MKEGYTNITIRTVDTDVLVLVVAAAYRLKIPELREVERIFDIYQFMKLQGV